MPEGDGQAQRRLVPDQQPADIFELFRNTSPACPAHGDQRIDRMDEGAPAERAQSDTPAMRAAARAYAFAWASRPCTQSPAGGVPIQHAGQDADRLVEIGYGYKGGKPWTE